MQLVLSGLGRTLPDICGQSVLVCMLSGNAVPRGVCVLVVNVFAGIFGMVQDKVFKKKELSDDF